MQQFLGTKLGVELLLKYCSTESARFSSTVQQVQVIYEFAIDFSYINLIPLGRVKLKRGRPEKNSPKDFFCSTVANNNLNGQSLILFVKIDEKIDMRIYKNITHIVSSSALVRGVLTRHELNSISCIDSTGFSCACDSQMR